MHYEAGDVERTAMKITSERRSDQNLQALTLRRAQRLSRAQQ